MNNHPVLFEKEQIDYFISIVKGHTTNEIIDLFNERFNRRLTAQQVKRGKRRFNITSDIDCKFKKGHSKGIETQFKKGNIPHNHKPVGYEFTRDDGYIEIKIAEPNKWVLKHNYIWEKEYGKIPKGYSVTFLDQNKNNFDLDNLKLIKREDMLTACSYRLFSKDKNVTETGILTAQLINKTKDIIKR